MHSATQQPTRASRRPTVDPQRSGSHGPMCSPRHSYAALPPADPGCCPRVTESRSGLEWHGSHSAIGNAAIRGAARYIAHRELIATETSGESTQRRKYSKAKVLEVVLEFCRSEKNFGQGSLLRNEPQSTLRRGMLHTGDFFSWSCAVSRRPVCGQSVCRACVCRGAFFIQIGKGADACGKRTGY